MAAGAPPPPTARSSSLKSPAQTSSLEPAPLAMPQNKPRTSRGALAWGSMTGHLPPYVSSSPASSSLSRPTALPHPGPPPFLHKTPSMHSSSPQPSQALPNSFASSGISVPPSPAPLGHPSRMSSIGGEQGWSGAGTPAPPSLVKAADSRYSREHDPDHPPVQPSCTSFSLCTFPYLTGVEQTVEMHAQLT